jgi:PhnB protein
MAVKPIPEGYNTVIPYLVVNGAAGLIDFAKQAFDAKEVGRMGGPDGKIGHAEIKIGDSLIMISDATQQYPARNAMLHVYVTDSDAVYQKAIQAGAKVVREIANQFYGDRSGGVEDRWGNQWWISTHVEDVAPDEMERRAKAAMKQQQGA